MAPAFSSNRQAACFAGMLIAIVLLPLLVGRSWLPARSEIYSSIPWRFGGHPYFHRTIFEETRDIDIAFIGSSRIWCGVNPLHVRQKLSESLGRDAEVTTLGWNTAGFDSLYFIAEDLLRNRKVKLLVINDEYNPEIGGTRPHRLASRWFRHAENAEDLAGLARGEITGYHASAVLGMPRNLLGMIRRNLPPRAAPNSQFSPKTLYQSRNPGDFSGALCVEKNFENSMTAFERYSPPSNQRGGEAVVYSDATRHLFGTSGPDMPALQLHFARKLATLAKQHHAKLIFLHHPSVDESQSETIREADIWPKILEGEVEWMGLPPDVFFYGMNSSERRKLFSDPNHLNRNGQQYFTPLITPKLIELYNEKMTS